MTSIYNWLSDNNSNLLHKEIPDADGGGIKRMPSAYSNAER